MTSSHLHHRNILPLIGILKNPRLCIVTPWIEPGDLLKYLKETNKNQLQSLVPVVRRLSFPPTLLSSLVP
jgi:hypothetical protein